MQIKAIILDLDNTIYPVSSIESLFDPLLDLVDKDGHHQKDMDRIREETMRRPFHLIAKDYHFSPELTEKCMKHLKELSYQGKIEPFDDYSFIKKLPVDKFLVTTGFPKLQKSKIESMNIK